MQIKTRNKAIQPQVKAKSHTMTESLTLAFTFKDKWMKQTLCNRQPCSMCEGLTLLSSVVRALEGPWWLGPFTTSPLTSKGLCWATKEIDFNMGM